MADIEQIFSRALEYEDPQERARFLEGVCGSDTVLYRRIQDLIQAEANAGDFLQRPAVEPISSIDPLKCAATDGKTQEPSLDFLSPSEDPQMLGRIGEFEVMGVLGSGGMGIVLRARDIKLGRLVAIKVMAPELLKRPAAADRFLREARAAAAISHDRVVATYWINDAHTPPFIVMELIEGISLQERIARDGPLPPRDVVQIGAEIADGLGAAHFRGLVHRDVKPGNILLQADSQRVKLTDFGLARAIDDTAVTQTGLITGTPQFMSPEQARAESVDARSDLFSLGSVLYAMCAGRPPFEAECSLAVLRRVAEETPQPIHRYNGDVPDWLEQTILKLLAKDPRNRFQQATEVAEILRHGQAHLREPMVVSAPQINSPFSPIEESDQATTDRASSGPATYHDPTASDATGSTHWNAVGVWVSLAFAVLVLAMLVPFLAFWFHRTISAPSHASVSDTFTDTPPEPPVGFERNESSPPPPSASSRAVPVQSLDLYATLQGHVQHVFSLEFSAVEPLLASGSTDGTARIWDFHRQRLVHILPGHAAGMDVAVAVHPDGNHAASGDGRGIIRFWDLETGKRVHQFQAHDAGITSVAFSHDGTYLASAGKDNLAIVWDFGTVERQGDLVHDAWVTDVVFSKDNSWLATSSHDATARIWNSGTLTEHAVLRHSSSVNALAFNPSGEQLVTAGEEGSVRLYDAASGTLLLEWTDHQASARDVAFSPDGKKIASGSFDATLRLYDASSGEAIATVESRTHTFNAIDFSPNGRLMATAGGIFKDDESGGAWIPDHDNKIRLWQMPTMQE